MGYEYVVIALSFGLATGIIGKGKGSSFWLWLITGTVLPLLGLTASEVPVSIAPGATAPVVVSVIAHTVSG